MKAIEVQGVSKWYGDFQAVKDVSFDVNAGELFAILGPNGAGKSTTIRMILDIIKPDAGSIHVLGAPISQETKNRIGYLPEERGLYKSVKVLEMMSYLGRLKGMTGADAKAKALALLEKLDLADFANNKVEELSKGMQQKVQFGVTVMHEPKVIIVDEPFSGLDPINRMVIQELLEDMVEQGCAVMMSTHQMNQVEAMADRMMMISHGERKLYGNVESIRKEYALHAIIIEGEGRWENLAGVERVEPLNQKSNAVMLHLKPNANSDEVLAAIAQSPDTNIQRFERAIPSLDDIFIRVVEGGKS
jgi:ABC-2 type transport system ATP-binding protein